jgi:hypothetical protein
LRHTGSLGRHDLSKTANCSKRWISKTKLPDRRPHRKRSVSSRHLLGGKESVVKELRAALEDICQRIYNSLNKRRVAGERPHAGCFTLFWGSTKHGSRLSEGRCYVRAVGGGDVAQTAEYFANLPGYTDGKGLSKIYKLAARGPAADVTEKTLGVKGVFSSALETLSNALTQSVCGPLTNKVLVSQLAKGAVVPEDVAARLFGNLPGFFKERVRFTAADDVFVETVHKVREVGRDRHSAGAYRGCRKVRSLQRGKCRRRRVELIRHRRRQAAELVERDSRGGGGGGGV